MKRLLLILCLAIVPVPVAAQDGSTTLSRFMESQFSDGDDRQVEITGFRGAMSSVATLDRMTIADPEGVWLVLENAVLDWNRSALLQGSLEVAALTAARIEIIRAPVSSDGLDLADTETEPFSLPDLPVRIEIGTVAIEEVVLGEALFGLAATLSVDGSVLLADGAGNAQIALDRLDAPTDQLALDVSYDNATQILDLSLLLSEAEGGIATELLGLPGRPNLQLEISGEGPINEFTADISLATDGEDRIAGQVISTGSDTGDQTIAVDIGGDISPLLLPDYQAFFGDDVQLQAQVRQTADGRTELETLNLTSAALSLTGDLAVDARGLPIYVDITGQITPPNGDTVRLPAGGVNAQLAHAALDVSYDREEDDQYHLQLSLEELSTGDLLISSTALDLQGAVAITETGIDAATAELSGTMADILHSDPALAQALGTEANLSAMVSWVHGAPVIVSNLSLRSGNLALSGGASAQTGENSLDVVVDLTASAANLSRFADLTGQPLNGAADISVTGQVEALSGAVNLAVNGAAQDLYVADAVPEEIFAGETQLSAQIIRNEAGLQLQDLNLANAELSLLADADLSAGDTSISTEFRLQNVGLFTDILSGQVTISADMARTGTEPFDVAVALSGPNEVQADLTGLFDLETTDFTLDLSASAMGLDIGNGVPAQLLAGRTQISAVATRTGDVLTLADLSVTNPEFQVTGDASMGPEISSANLATRLANVGLFTDALAGPVSADAILTRAATDPWQVQADIAGPGGISAALNGHVGMSDGSVDISATGQAPLALANQYIGPQSIQGTLGYNISMRGQPGLGAVSGSVSANGARVALPDYALAIEDVGFSGQLSGGQMTLNTSGTFSTGGQLTAQGSINLASAGMDGQIAIGVRDARVVDSTLYEARISSADVTISGALATRPQVNGTVVLGETEIRVPEASIYSSEAIPEIVFTGQNSAERLTRQFAGFLAQSSGGSGGSATTGLDITITAPGRIFLRGRGIDAEFGGALRVFGTSANMIPTGQFNLLRGRLSLLGTRLDFTEGSATLQGSFDPFLNLAATTRANGYEITIGVTGAASSPDISFSSSPSLPEDEVLAQLLFGRSVSGLSPLQLLQLADAATSLAGGSTNAGFIAGLRDGLGLDDLDLSTDEEGNAEVTAGRYLSDNVYTDVTVNAEGDVDLSLNIDLTPNITARGSVGSDGGSTIGIFFEQDY